MHCKSNGLYQLDLLEMIIQAGQSPSHVQLFPYFIRRGPSPELAIKKPLEINSSYLYIHHVSQCSQPAEVMLITGWPCLFMQGLLVMRLNLLLARAHGSE